MNTELIIKLTEDSLEELNICLVHFKNRQNSEKLSAEKLIGGEVLKILVYLNSFAKLQNSTIQSSIQIFNSVFKNHNFTEDSIWEMMKNYQESSEFLKEKIQKGEIEFPLLLELALQYDQYFEKDKFYIFSKYLVQLIHFLIESDSETSPAEMNFLNNYTKMISSKKKSSEEDKSNLISELKKIYQNLIHKESSPTKNKEIIESSPNQIQTEKKEEVKTIVKEEKIPLEKLFEELNSLIGLQSIKEEVKTLINLLKVEILRKEKNLPIPDKSLHMVFSGNPGTGKTTIARLLAKFFYTLGISEKGTLVETDRSGLVAGFVGQTAPKTLEVCKSALGGVLFIDEAYSLSVDSENDFGKEAIETLLKFMEDNRTKLIVIVAGYTENMKVFISKNPGLESRFNRYLNFPDYTPEELWEILKKQLSKVNMNLSQAAKLKLKDKIETEFKNRNDKFGNARFIRNLFERIYMKQANRIADLEKIDEEKLSKIEVEDID
jgi:SpoVK/Ycf46/Vps4 family AAA+-type ATPase